MADETKNHGSEKKYGQFHRRVFEANILNFAVWATIAIGYTMLGCSAVGISNATCTRASACASVA